MHPRQFSEAAVHPSRRQSLICADLKTPSLPTAHSRIWKTGFTRVMDPQARSMFDFIQRRLAIRRYRKKLGPYLQQRFGWRANYSPAEVDAGATELGLFTGDICYAYAMFCTRGDFDRHHAATGEHCDYTTMHAETQGFGTGYEGHSSHRDSGGDWSHSHGHDAGSHHGGHDFGGHDSGGHDFGGHDSGGDCGGGGDAGSN
jgi:hypothetical protein